MVPFGVRVGAFPAAEEFIITNVGLAPGQVGLIGSGLNKILRQLSLKHKKPVRRHMILLAWSIGNSRIFAGICKINSKSVEATGSILYIICVHYTKEKRKKEREEMKRNGNSTLYVRMLSHSY